MIILKYREVAKMAKFKIGVHRKQPTLFPERIEDYIPDGHLAKLVVEIVENLNLQKIIDKYSDKGQRAFSPKILIGILFYGYAIGLRSSRKFRAPDIPHISA